MNLNGILNQGNTCFVNCECRSHFGQEVFPKGSVNSGTTGNDAPSGSTQVIKSQSLAPLKASNTCSFFKILIGLFGRLNNPYGYQS